MIAVGAFGASMVVFGLSQSFWLSLGALAVGRRRRHGERRASARTMVPLVTPDELRGRVNAVEMVFISASNELGAFESGVAAALIGAVPAVVIGGVADNRVAVGVDPVLPRPAPRRPPRRAPAGRDHRLAARSANPP